MNQTLHLSVSPHIHRKNSTRRVMGDVLLALFPATLAGVILFGYRALWVIAVCVGTAVLGEALFQKFRKKPCTVGDLSAAVTGLLLALNLPAQIPLWQAALGALFAIVCVKGLFGGLGQNFANPAVTGRVFLIVAFSSMTQSSYPVVVDTVASATPLTALSAGENPAFWDLLFGVHGGCIGETCAAALLLGGVYLLFRRRITWHIPVSFLLTVFILSLLYEGGEPLTALRWLLSGGLLIGAFFMATDYVTAPTRPIGKVVFGFGCGCITCLIRFFGNYPEGVSFAILLMNLLTPYLDRIPAKRVLGGDRV